MTQRIFPRYESFIPGLHTRLCSVFVGAQLLTEDLSLMQEQNARSCIRKGKKRSAFMVRENTHSNAFYDLWWNLFTHLFPHGLKKKCLCVCVNVHTSKHTNNGGLAISLWGNYLFFLFKSAPKHQEQTVFLPSKQSKSLIKFLQ